MLLLKVDRTGDVPAYQQVCDQIAAQAETGALQPGDRLPSTRSLAVSLGLHRSSVVRAYAELRALGYLESRPGSYSTIRQRPRLPTTRLDDADRDTDSLIDWDAIARPSVCSLRDHSVAATSTHGEVIDLDRLCADPSLAPDDALRRCLKTELLRTGGAALDYAEASGWLPLKEVIARRMCNHGVMVSTEEILITAGAQQALDLVLRYLASPGDGVVVEAPTYGMAHSLLKLHEVQPIEVPLLADGMDLDALQHVLHKKHPRPKLIFTMPNFHNPTGITLSAERREALARLSAAYDFLIVADGSTIFDMPAGFVWFNYRSLSHLNFQLSIPLRNYQKY